VLCVFVVPCLVFGPIAYLIMLWSDKLSVSLISQPVTLPIRLELVIVRSMLLVHMWFLKVVLFEASLATCS